MPNGALLSIGASLARRARLLAPLVLAGALVACGSSDPGPPGGGGGDGRPQPSGECRVFVASDITIPTRLANDGDGCDYEFAGRLDVTSQLTIDPGTEVRFQQDAQLHVSRGGSIVAQGTADERIVLRGLVEVHGYWTGFCFADSRRSVFDFVDIRHAGKVGGTGATTVCRAAIGHGAGTSEPIDITNTTILGSYTSGLDATSLTLGAFGNNVFADNLEYGVRVGAANAHRLDQASDYLGTSLGEANRQPYVHVSGVLQDPGAMHVWTPLNVPYRNGGDEGRYHPNIIVDDATGLRLLPGTVMLFDDDGGINVWDDSVFEAAGTAEAPVVLTGVRPVPGTWDGVHVLDASLVMTFTEVSYGGDTASLYAGNVAVAGTGHKSANLTDVLIAHSASCGLRLSDPERTEGTLERVVLRENATNACGFVLPEESGGEPGRLESARTL